MIGLGVLVFIHIAILFGLITYFSDRYEDAECDRIIGKKMVCFWISGLVFLIICFMSRDEAMILLPFYSSMGTLTFFEFYWWISSR